jgi:hypothetical protein
MSQKAYKTTRKIFASFINYASFSVSAFLTIGNIASNAYAPNKNLKKVFFFRWEPVLIKIITLIKRSDIAEKLIVFIRFMYFFFQVQV